MLLLDQTAEWTPIWTFFNNFSFYGQPFAWLSMNNSAWLVVGYWQMLSPEYALSLAVGGNLGLVGSLEAVNQGVADATASGHGGLRAVGLDPEGINQNAAYWEFVTDTAWRAGLANTSAYLEVRGGEGGTRGGSDAPSPQDWGVRRCGVDLPAVRQAWALLGQTVYSPTAPAYEHHMKVSEGGAGGAEPHQNGTPSDRPAQYCGTTMPVAGSGWDTPMIRAGYAASLLARAWQALLAAAPSCRGTAHLHDLIGAGRSVARGPPLQHRRCCPPPLADVTREFLVLFPCVAGHDALLGAKTVAAVNAAAASVAGVMQDLDAALATQPGFLVGAWIGASRPAGLAGGCVP